MELENSFRAIIIEGNRITIKKDVMQDLNLKLGERIKVTVEKIHKGTEILG